MIVEICQCCRYTVIPKTKKCLEDIGSFIKNNHFDQCGIIYCLSRMDCEKVAEKLQVYHLYKAIYFFLCMLLYCWFPSENFLNIHNIMHDVNKMMSVFFFSYNAGIIMY